MMRTALALREKGRVHIDGHYNKCTYNCTQHICLHSYPMFWQLAFDESQLPRHISTLSPSSSLTHQKEVTKYKTQNPFSMIANY